jgi:hypothetical protein
MGFFAWVNSRIKRMRWYNISVLKICVLAFALWVAKLWPVVLGLNAWVYAIVWIVSMLYLFWVLFR